MDKEKVLIRMPGALKEVLTVQASAAMRSFNSEVVSRLWLTLGETPTERLAVMEGMRADAGPVKGPQMTLALARRKGPKSAKAKSAKRKGVRRG